MSDIQLVGGLTVDGKTYRIDNDTHDESFIQIQFINDAYERISRENREKLGKLFFDALINFGKRWEEEKMNES